MCIASRMALRGDPRGNIRKSCYKTAKLLSQQMQETCVTSNKAPLTDTELQHSHPWKSLPLCSAQPMHLYTDFFKPRASFQQHGVEAFKDRTKEHSFVLS